MQRNGINSRRQSISVMETSSAKGRLGGSVGSGSDGADDVVAVEAQSSVLEC
jgi:hypothetical protein